MAYQRETKVGVGTPPNRSNVNNTMPGGPLVSTQEPPPYNSTTSAGAKAVNAVKPRTAMERIGFWAIAIAAIVLILVLSGFILPPIVGGLISATYISGFVGFLTLMNLSKPSGWANAVLGRRVFPVLAAGQDSDVMRLAGVNATLVFLFSFFYSVVATFLGGFLGGLGIFLDQI